jgi:hypothetical protein
MGILFAIVVTAIFLSAVRWFRLRYKVGVYYINLVEELQEEALKAKQPFDINDLKPENYDHAMDLRGTPTHLCPCGCNIWSLKVMFEDFEISTYFLDMECANCGSKATAPTLIDREKME